MSPPDHESAILAAVLLAQRAQQGEDVSEATDRLAELAGQEDEEEEPSVFGEWDESKHARDRGRFARSDAGQKAAYEIARAHPSPTGKGFHSPERKRWLVAETLKDHALGGPDPLPKLPPAGAPRRTLARTALRAAEVLGLTHDERDWLHSREAEEVATAHEHGPALLAHARDSSAIHHEKARRLMEDVTSRLPEALPVALVKKQVGKASVIGMEGIPETLRPLAEKLLAAIPRADVKATGMTVVVPDRDTAPLVEALSTLGAYTTPLKEQAEDIFKASKASPQLAIPDVPPEARGETVGGEREEGAEGKVQHKRLNRDLYVRYDPKKDRYDFVAKEDTPALIGVPRHLFGEGDDWSEYEGPPDAGA